MCLGRGWADRLGCRRADERSGRVVARGGEGGGSDGGGGSHPHRRWPGPEGPPDTPRPLQPPPGPSVRAHRDPGGRSAAGRAGRGPPSRRPGDVRLAGCPLVARSSAPPTAAPGAAAAGRPARESAQEAARGVGRRRLLDQCAEGRARRGARIEETQSRNANFCTPGLKLDMSWLHAA